MNSSYQILLFVIIFVIILVYVNYENILINLLVFSIVNRGLLSPNCFWWSVNDLISDSNGIQLYNNLKRKYGDMIPINIMTNKMYLVTDVNSITEILDNSPDIFCVGHLKFNFFKSFMQYNVGVSQGCPWKKRRIVNEHVLMTNKLHTNSDFYNNKIKSILENHGVPKNFTDFNIIAKEITSIIVFGLDSKYIPTEIFDIFSIANSISSLYDPHFEIPSNIKQNYRDFIWKHINNPHKHSLLDVLSTIYQSSTINKDELIDQVPHWIFPIAGLIHSVTTRTLVLLHNNPSKLQKLCKQITNININDSQSISNLYYLKSSILETLRLNNQVASTFRTLCTDYTFKNGTTYRKGEQFVILNNPVLQDPEYWTNPDQFIPERWTPQLEKMYFAISFNQGPQSCPGRELSIFIVSSMICHWLHMRNYKFTTNIILDKHISKMINPCSIIFYEV